MKIGFIIQARMGSTRLPGKVLMPLPQKDGKSCLQWITDSLQSSGINAQIAVATSRNPENTPIREFCERLGVSCFQGDEENVLRRFTSIIKDYQIDCAVRLTADNPIIDTNLLEETIHHHLSAGNDYTKTIDLPLGMNFEIVNAKALLDLETHTLDKTDEEHVTFAFYRFPKFKSELKKLGIPAELTALRLTMDYPSDYTLLSQVLSLTKNDPSLKGLGLVQFAFHVHPDWFELNRKNVQNNF
jgi:spore coat polysaccharide biosynthesis protein SpsF